MRSARPPQDRKFGCPKCEKKFFTPKDLRRHENTHLGLREHVCQSCLQRFGRKDHLTRHAKKSCSAVKGKNHHHHHNHNHHHHNHSHNQNQNHNHNHNHHDHKPSSQQHQHQQQQHSNSQLSSYLHHPADSCGEQQAAYAPLSDTIGYDQQSSYLTDSCFEQPNHQYETLIESTTTTTAAAAASTTAAAAALNQQAPLQPQPQQPQPQPHQHLHHQHQQHHNHYHQHHQIRSHNQQQQQQESPISVGSISQSNSFTDYPTVDVYGGSGAHLHELMNEPQPYQQQQPNQSQATYYQAAFIM